MSADDVSSQGTASSSAQFANSLTRVPQSDFELVYPRPGKKVLIDQEPTGRSGHSMVADESNLYIVGGFNPLGRTLHRGTPTVFQELWRFNFATRKWRKLQTIGLPPTCASSCLQLCGNRLFLFGGTSYPFGQTSSNTIRVCDLTSPQRDLETGSYTVYRWVDLRERVTQTREDLLRDQDTTPPRGYGQSIIFHGQYIYTFGGAVGFYDEAVRDLHRLDLSTLMWEMLSPAGEAPDGRYKQEIIKDRDCFYIVGGGRLHDAQPVHILYCYTYTSNEWSKRIIAPHPTHATPKSRCAFGLVQVGRDVYICGGQFYRVNVSLPEILNDIWHFSLDSFQWTKLSVSLPERMYFHRVAVSPSKHLYVYGGVLESGKRSSRLYRYQLPHQVPELREMCWCTITSLWRDLHRADPTELLENYGIPQKFIDRLQG